MLLVLSIICSNAFVLAKSVSVKGYYRKDGTYVQPHMRSSPDGSFYNNWSTKGNINPYTGAEGTRNYPSSGYGIGSSGFINTPYTGYSNNYYPASAGGNSYALPNNYNYFPASPSNTSLNSPSNGFQYGGLPNTGTSVPSQNSDPDEFQKRRKVEQRLKRKGISVEANQFKLDELLDMECRYELAQKLSLKGHNVDWQNFTLSQLLDMDERKGLDENLKKQGIAADWQNTPLDQLIKMQNAH